MIGPRLLFINLGSGADGYSGGSRAGQYMLLDQAFREARGLTPYASPNALLTPAGRETIARYLAGGRIVCDVDRAADIRQLLEFSRKNGLHPIITGGAEAWKVAAELKAANATVFIHPLQDLPSGFDQLGSRLDNAALLAKAGVRVAFLVAGRHPQLAQDPPRRRQCGRQWPAVGSGTGGDYPRARRSARRRRQGWPDRNRIECRPRAVGRRSAGSEHAWPVPCGCTASRCRCVHGRPNCSIATCRRRARCRARIRTKDAPWPRPATTCDCPSPPRLAAATSTLAFNSESADGLAAELQQALRGSELFEQLARSAGRSRRGRCRPWRHRSGGNRQRQSKQPGHRPGRQHRACPETCSSTACACWPAAVGNCAT